MSIHVASAVAAQREYALELLNAVRQCCQVGVFSPNSWNSALVLGNSVRVWGILTLRLRCWAAKHKRLGHRLLWLALRSFSWEFHPMKFLREVMFAVWVHG